MHFIVDLNRSTGRKSGCEYRSTIIVECLLEIVCYLHSNQLVPPFHSLSGCNYRMKQQNPQQRPLIRIAASCHSPASLDRGHRRHGDCSSSGDATKYKQVYDKNNRVQQRWANVKLLKRGKLGVQLKRRTRQVILAEILRTS